MQKENKKRSIKFVQISFLDIEENKKYNETIERVIKTAFEEEKIDKINIYVNIILTNPKNIQKINKEYRNIDKATDVLSFPMFEKDEIESMKKNENDVLDVLGDIVISIDKVTEQALEYGHSFERELSYMVIHGFYHLMGYDHIKAEDKKLMREKEENILNLLDIKR